jgi:hypothetical protein
VVNFMKSLALAAAAALTFAAGTAQAVTVAATEADNASVTVGSITATETATTALDGQNINGSQITFSLLGTSSDPRTSAAIRFSLPGAARLTFDEYPGSETSGYVLYQIGGPTLSTGGLFAPGGGLTVPLVTGEGSRIGNGSPAIVTPGVIVDSISGGGSFVPGGDWVLGFWDSGNPLTGDIKFTVTAIPLPASAWMLFAAVAALAWGARRRAV